ncbi:hypothetical protein CA13_31260 [Planctomycetes bacterium CA13]|uniref:Uncharacterized protein n=1 Tax=Novipirellula herctigrandis TaxID=2527986 RepID=A0A5C5Z535_9BACT|nr:hypothetical protein CA13_31260 [Planctomycetes bacterium CA13]
MTKPRPCVKTMLGDSEAVVESDIERVVAKTSHQVIAFEAGSVFGDPFLEGVAVRWAVAPVVPTAVVVSIDTKFDQI